MIDHLSNVFNIVTTEGLDALLLVSPENVRYALGIDLRVPACLLILASGAVNLVTDEGAPELPDRLQAVKRVIPGYGKDFFDVVEILARDKGLVSLGVEEDALTHCEFLILSQKVRCTLSDISSRLVALRSVKDSGELSALKQARQIAFAAFEKLVSELREGMSEQQAAARLQYDMLLFGCEGMSFPPLVQFGESTCRVHAMPTKRRLREGELVVVDCGCIVDGYCSDITRTFCYGPPTEEYERIFSTVKEAQRAAILYAKAGVSASALDFSARRVIERAGYGAGFTFDLGHGLGLKVHEPPFISPFNFENLLPGAVIAVEPGIYIKDRFGIRLEDMLLLSENGCEVIGNTAATL